MATKNQTNQESVIMKQYANLKKSKYADALLLFRCGNFYEVYEEDAKVAADVLGITLVSESDITKAVFPYHALDTYLPMLIRAGKRVAICDQIEAPKQPKSKTTTENKNTETKTTNTETTMTTTKNTTTESMNVQPAQVENTTEQIVSMGNDLPEVKFATYTTKKGATAPQIIGFGGEDDPRWKRLYEAKPKWVSASWYREIDGSKSYRLIFGVRYMEAAKALTKVYNTDDREAWQRVEQECQTIYEQAQADGKARWESKKAEWAAKRAERENKTMAEQTVAQPTVKTYTEQEVAALMQRVMVGDAEAIAQVNAILQKAA